MPNATCNLGMTMSGQRLSCPKNLIRDEGGNILPMAAAGVLVMAALVGGGVDMSRAYKVQNRLQNACDAGVLAGRRAVTTAGFDSAASAQANTYFNVNFNEAEQGTHSTTFLASGDDEGNAIGGHASTQMPLLIMQMFGNHTMTISANCASTMGVGNSDITMVLDVTGSMGTALGTGTRISALKTAMKNFYTTLSTATQGTNARVRYSFVPFSTTVNVGRLLYDLDPDYLADESTIQSRVPVYRTVTNTVQSGWNPPVNTTGSSESQVTLSATARYDNNRYRSLSSCNSAKPADTDWQDDGPPSTSSSTQINGSGQQVVTTTTSQDKIKTSYTCSGSGTNYRLNYYESYKTAYSHSYSTSDPVYTTTTSQVFDRFDYKPVVYDTSVFKTFASVSTPTGSNGSAQSSSWDGCIQERQTVAASSISYSSLLGLTPSGAMDLDIDMEPGSDNATKWAPLWRQVAYLRRTVAPATSGSLATSYCVPAAQAFTEMTRTEFDSYANALTAQGNTYLDIGMIWGGRLSSPDGIFASTVNEDPANGGNVARHIIYMTDGTQEANASTYMAYGIESLDRRITSNGTTTQADARHSLRFRAACDQIKAKGIRIWAIGFTSGLTADLAYCASPNSSYTANTAAQLNSAFQEIAKQVGELRVLS